MKTIMITGIGGEIGRNIASIIADEYPTAHIIGVDIHNHFPHTYFCHEFVLGMPVVNEHYFEHLQAIVNIYQPDLVIPASEVELRFFHNRRILTINNVPLLFASHAIMDIGFDKLLTANYLKNQKLPYPITYEVSNLPKYVELPMIAKSKDGAGSKQIIKVTENNIESVRQQYPNWIMQQYLQPDDEEYTCGLFKSRLGHVQHITFKRTLVGGSTGFGEVVNNETINSLLESFANNFDFSGSINVQLRLTEQGPVIFEINPRFSSTVLFRHMLGFKDVKWAIDDMFKPLQSIDFVREKVVGKKIFKDNRAIIF